MNCAVHNQTQAVAYCRTCGKALCEDCKRDVMGAIYCEPCIAARLQGQPAAGVAAPPISVPSAPSPAVAALLGFIPGVGAMYNGQFTKAFAHVVIFVLLIVAIQTPNFGWVFGILMPFFIFYMAFEAYKTAEAKRLGLPAPDPLGLDKMLGLQESQPAPPFAPGVMNPNLATGAPPEGFPVQVAPPPPPTATDNTPVGAVLLLVLGFAFLLNNFGLLHVGRMLPLVLIGFGLWLAYKRTAQQQA
jgi:B-box zinc finger